MTIQRYILVTLLALGGVTTRAQSEQTAGDWPQWQGPDRTGISRETGLLREWPSSGPAVLWSATDLGSGYGSVAIKGDRIFVQGMKGSTSIVSALSRADGKPVWSKSLGPSVSNDQGSGPRGTPTVDGDRLYVLTESGDLACLKRRRDGGVAAQHPEGFRRPEHQMADQRVAAGRRQQRDRDAGWSQCRHGRARQDDREDGLDQQES